MKNFYSLIVIYNPVKQEVIARDYTIDSIAKIISAFTERKKKNMAVITSNGRDVTKWAIMKSKVVKGD